MKKLTSFLTSLAVGVFFAAYDDGVNCNQNSEHCSQTRLNSNENDPSHGLGSLSNA